MSEHTDFVEYLRQFMIFRRGVYELQNDDRQNPLKLHLV